MTRGLSSLGFGPDRHDTLLQGQLLRANTTLELHALDFLRDNRARSNRRGRIICVDACPVLDAGRKYRQPHIIGDGSNTRLTIRVHFPRYGPVFTALAILPAGRNPNRLLLHYTTRLSKHFTTRDERTRRTVERLGQPDTAHFPSDRRSLQPLSNTPHRPVRVSENRYCICRRSKLRPL